MGKKEDFLYLISSGILLHELQKILNKNSKTPKKIFTASPQHVRNKMDFFVVVVVEPSWAVPKLGCKI